MEKLRLGNEYGYVLISFIVLGGFPNGTENDDYRLLSACAAGRDWYVVQTLKGIILMDNSFRRVLVSKKSFFRN